MKSHASPVVAVEPEASVWLDLDDLVVHRTRPPTRPLTVSSFLLIAACGQRSPDPMFACKDQVCWSIAPDLVAPPPGEGFPEVAVELLNDPAVFELDGGATMAVARDLLLVRPADDRSWRQLQRKYGFEEVEDKWALASEQRLLTASGVEVRESLDHLVRIDPDAAWPGDLAAWMVELGQTSSMSFTDRDTRNLFAIAAQIRVEDSRKGKVYFVPLTAAAAESQPSTARTYTYPYKQDAEDCECYGHEYAEGGDEHCDAIDAGCVVDGRRHLNGDNPCDYRDWEDGAATDALLLEDIQLFDARAGDSPFYTDGWYQAVEDIVDGCSLGTWCDAPLVGPHMWVVPESALPFSLDLLVWDDSIPPGAVDSPPPGTHQDQDDDASRCEFIETPKGEVEANPEAFARSYRHMPVYEWTEHSDDERVFLLLFDGDECKDLPVLGDITSFLGWFGWDSAERIWCNPDDPLAWFWLNRSDTVDADETRLDTWDGGARAVLDDRGETDFPDVADSHDDIMMTVTTVRECQEGAFESVCDGHDDDCDGAIDETEAFGGAPVVSNECGKCGDEFIEVCNGVDDDCDDEVDEGAIDLPYDAIVGCCDDPCQATEEVCDGIDNDCDCEVDEEYPQAGAACGSTLGNCEPGLWICEDGGLVCEGGIEPAEEVCGDREDNDCDGSTDEDFLCCEGEASACGLTAGECSEGVQTCTDNAWGACEGQVAPVAETCNGLDDDCDGTIDDNVTCACDPVLDSPRACGVATGDCEEGLQSCEVGYWGACEGADYAHYWDGLEGCDGADNDCDGGVDEYISAEACATACGTGDQECVGGEWDACDATQPEEEECNGVDDDCNGATDDDLDNAACPLQDGVCAGSVRTCGGTVGWESCGADEYGADYESIEISCDGLDNDCDGHGDDEEGLIFVGDVNNCGGCDQVCAAIDGIASCVPAGPSEHCELLCDGGFVDLDEEGDNGCEATCEATELTTLGSAGATGLYLTANQGTFTTTGNGTTTLTVPKPDGDAFFVIPYVATDDPDGEDDLGWWLTWAETSSDFEIYVERKWGDGGHTLAGGAVVLGFEGDFSAYPSDDLASSLCTQGQDSAAFSLNPVAWEGFDKFISLGFITDHDTSTDDDYGWQMSWSNDSDCNADWTSSDYDGNSGSDVRYQGCQLALPRDVRVESWDFSVLNGDSDSHTFTVDSGADHLWIPLVTTYRPETDDDFGYVVECTTPSSTALTCTVDAFDGNSSSYVQGQVLLLENPDGF